MRLCTSILWSQANIRIYVILFSQISDSIHVSDAAWYNDFISLQYAMYFSAFVCVIGGGFFLLTSLYIEEDKLNADQFIASKMDHRCDI